jgi:hypothetical protein
MALSAVIRLISVICHDESSEIIECFFYARKDRGREAVLKAEQLPSQSVRRTSKKARGKILQHRLRCERVLQ